MRVTSHLYYPSTNINKMGNEERVVKYLSLSKKHSTKFGTCLDPHSTFTNSVRTFHVYDKINFL